MSLIMTACKRATMASREELLQSIYPGMKLDRAFFLKAYGYEITWPGFAEKAIKALEDAGCGRAREYYGSIVSEYEKGYQEQIMEAGKWYLNVKGSEELRKEQSKAKQRSREQNWMEVSKILGFRSTKKGR